MSIFRLLCLYLLPWAKFFDWLSMLLALRWRKLVPLTWWLAAAMLTFTMGAHVIALYHLVHSLAPLRGLWTPCVCHASWSSTGNLSTHNSNRSVCVAYHTGFMFDDLLALVQGLWIVVISRLSIVSLTCEAILSWPRAFLFTVGLIVSATCLNT